MPGVISVAMVSTVILFGGCAGDAEESDDPVAVDFERDIQPIFDGWCVGCHDFHVPHLTTGESWAQLTETESRWECWHDSNPRFVVPGDPDGSFLMYKLTGQMSYAVAPEVGTCGRLMPANSGGTGIDRPLLELDPEAVETIRGWIAAGAQP